MPGRGSKATLNTVPIRTLGVKWEELAVNLTNLRTNLDAKWLNDRNRERASFFNNPATTNKMSRIITFTQIVNLHPGNRRVYKTVII
jgi:hypothetical protein